MTSRPPQGAVLEDGADRLVDLPPRRVHAGGSVGERELVEPGGLEGIPRAPGQVEAALLGPARDRLARPRRAPLLDPLAELAEHDVRADGLDEPVQELPGAVAEAV